MSPRDRDQLPWYPYYPSDFEEGTSDMSLSEVGAYQRLLNVQWAKKGIPGDNISKLASVLRCTRSSAKSVWNTLREKFNRGQDGLWRNERLERIRAKQEQRQHANRHNGLRGSERRWGDSERYSEEMAIAINSPSGWGSENMAIPEPEPEDQNTKRSDLPPKVPKLRQRFETWWANYPRRVGKTAAWREWQRIEPSDEQLVEMQAVLVVQKQSRDWTKDGGAFIPHPRTYLHQGRWQDEVAVEVATQSAGPFWDECPKCGEIHQLDKPCPSKAA